MLLITKKTELFFIIFSIFFSRQILAQEVTTDETELRDILAPLGNNIVGKSLPGIVINDPHRYLSGRPGKYIYQKILKDNKNTITKFEMRSEFDSEISDLRK